MYNRGMTWRWSVQKLVCENACMKWINCLLDYGISSALVGHLPEQLSHGVKAGIFIWPLIDKNLEPYGELNAGPTMCSGHSDLSTSHY